MNNGKYHTQDYRDKQSAKVDERLGPVKEHRKECCRCGRIYTWTGRERTKSYKKSKFCSRSCANNRQSTWDTKISEGESSGKWIRYREVAFRHHGEKCVVCGFDQIIEVHHLDHDRDNNSKENLVPLCPNHHAMIHRSKFAHNVLDVIHKYLNGL